MMKIILNFCIAVSLSLFSFPSHADISMLGFGFSKHMGCLKKGGCQFNEINPGIGIEYANLISENNQIKWFARGGIYKDSLKQTAFYGAVGIRKDLDLNLPYEIKPGIGIQTGYRTGKHESGFILPFAYLQKSKLALEVGYTQLPKSYQEKHQFKSLLTFNLRYDF